jgi:hypothetical protein
VDDVREMPGSSACAAWGEAPASTSIVRIAGQTPATLQTLLARTTRHTPQNPKLPIVALPLSIGQFYL